MAKSNSLILDEAVLEEDQASLRLLRGVLLTIAAEADRLSPTAIGWRATSSSNSWLSVVQRASRGHRERQSAKACACR
ncbi:hypothetical protein GCM10020220_085810 [Nonomuraea rubra]